jgi:hypothetical protein
VRAPRAGYVEGLKVTAGQQVFDSSVLFTIKVCGSFFNNILESVCCNTKLVLSFIIIRDRPIVIELLKCIQLRRLSEMKGKECRNQNM